MLHRDIERTVLFIAANPKDMPGVEFKEEISAIKRGLHLISQPGGRNGNDGQPAPWGDLVILQDLQATIQGVIMAIIKHKPEIVHFSGKGKGEAGLAFPDETGAAKFVKNTALERIFKACSDYVHCVVLSACLSKAQAPAIVKYIDHVIGMNDNITNDMAVNFAAGFYTALGEGKNYAEAFADGRLMFSPNDDSHFSIPIHREKAVEQNEAMKHDIYSEPTIDVSQEEFTIVLSGGGLRATLFHLGIFVLLAEQKLLGRTYGLVSVSGGSILAAHFAKNWEKSRQGVAGFNSVAAALVAFARSDLRNRVIVPWIWSRLTLFWWHPRFSRTTLLQNAYKKFYKLTTLHDLDKPDCPRIAIAATDSIRQERVAITQREIYQLPVNFDDSTPGQKLPSIEWNGELLSLAVAASSCFSASLLAYETNSQGPRITI